MVVLISGTIFHVSPEYEKKCGEKNHLEIGITLDLEVLMKHMIPLETTMTSLL